MTLQILYFAGVSDLVGLAEEVLSWSETPPQTVAQLAARLLERHGRLRLGGVRFAVNEEFVDQEHLLASGDVVALIPPVSGG